LTGANFTGAQLWNVDFSGANLTDTDFTGAKMPGVNLQGAIFCRTKLPAGEKNSGC